MTEISYKEIRKSEEINTYIEQGDAVLGELGYTEHSRKHAARTAETAGKILKELGYEKKKQWSWQKSQGTCMIWETASTVRTTPIPAP